MPIARLTKRTVDAAGHATADVFVWDDEQRGFGLKVTPRGVKVFVYQYRLGGRGSKTKRWTIGRYGAPWTPDKARDEAKRLAVLVDQGVDPVEEHKRRRRTALTLGFATYVETFAEGYLKTEWGSSWPQAKRQLEMHALPHLGDTPLPDIRPENLNAVLDALRSMPGVQRSVWAVLSKLFVWAEKREDIDQSPMAKMVAPKGAKARKRVLSPDEVIACWRASYALEEPRGALLRLLMITLQRRSEVAALSWTELSQADASWRLPGERAKNGQDHLVPLSELAMAELDANGWKRRGLSSSCSTGITPVSNFSDMKAALDTAMKPILQELADKRADADGEDGHEVEFTPWRLHDLRRTGATNLQALGFPIEVTERVINHHQGGEAAGIRGVYNLYEYLPEKTRALNAWSDRLKQMISEEASASNVVPLASARA